VTGDKVGITAVDEIARSNPLRAKTQVRNRNSPGFFRVVDEITLNIQVSAIANNFDAVFVCANRTIAAQTVKKRLYRLCVCIGTIGSIPIQTCVAEIIVYANSEVIFGFFIIEDYID
jgi:hypothetical protein